jgi:cytochrome b subunit of formate dehydrogenase
MVHLFRRTLRGKNYDEFLVERSRVPPLQFWGLVLLGVSLIITGIGMMMLFVLRVSSGPFDSIRAFALLFPAAICAGIIYLGVLHVRRALAGRL